MIRGQSTTSGMWCVLPIGPITYLLAVSHGDSLVLDRTGQVLGSGGQWHQGWPGELINSSLRRARQ